MTRRESIIKQILNIEWHMFRKVSKCGELALCHSAPDTFNKIRESIFETWSPEAHKSYLDDLKNALNKGRNFLTEKYARRDNLIPPLRTNPLIDKIVEIETGRQEEA